jgi:hypothetical protein
VDGLIDALARAMVAPRGGASGDGLPMSLPLIDFIYLINLFLYLYHTLYKCV